MFLCIIINDSRKYKLRMTAGETIERNSGLGGGGLQNWIVKYFFDVALELFLQKKRLTTILIINWSDDFNAGAFTDRVGQEI